MNIPEGSIVVEGDCAGFITGGTTVLVGVQLGNIGLPSLKQGDRLILVIPPKSDSEPSA